MSHALKILFTLVFVTGIALGERVLQSFAVWEANHTYIEKANLYHGWTNGFLSASRHNPNKKEQKRVIDFAECLDAKVTYPEAVALIDKYFKEHPESHQELLAEMFLKALTVAPSPCEGKDPYQ